MNDSSETLKDKLLKQALEEKLGSRRPPDLSEQILSGVERKSNARTGWQVVSLTVALGLLFLAGVALIVPEKQEPAGSERVASNEGNDVKKSIVKVATPSVTSRTSLSSSELAVIRKAVQKKYDAMLKRYGELKYVTVEHLVIEEVAKFKVHRVERQLREEARMAKVEARRAWIEARRAWNEARQFMLKANGKSKEQQEIEAIFRQFAVEGLPTLPNGNFAFNLAGDGDQNYTNVLSHSTGTLTVDFTGNGTVTIQGYDDSAAAIGRSLTGTGSGGRLVLDSTGGPHTIANTTIVVSGGATLTAHARLPLGAGSTVTLDGGRLELSLVGGTAGTPLAQSPGFAAHHDAATISMTSTDISVTALGSSVNSISDFSAAYGALSIAPSTSAIVKSGLNSSELELADGQTFQTDGTGAVTFDSLMIANPGGAIAVDTIGTSVFNARGLDDQGNVSVINVTRSSGVFRVGGSGTQSFDSITTTGTGVTIDFISNGIVTSPDFDDQTSGARTVDITQSAGADGRLVFTGGTIVATDTTFTVNPGATLAGEGPAPFGAGASVVLSGGTLEAVDDDANPQPFGAAGTSIILDGGRLDLTLGGVKELRIAASPNVHYDDATIAVADGAAVTAWADVSGNDRHLTTYRGTPKFNANAVNGLPAVNFENESLVMDVAEGYFPEDAFIVFRSSNQDNPTYWSAEYHSDDEQSSRLSRNDENFWDGEKPSKVVWNGHNIPDSNHTEVGDGNILNVSGDVHLGSVSITAGEDYMIAFTHAEGGGGDSQLRGWTRAPGISDRIIRPQGDAARSSGYNVTNSAGRYGTVFNSLTAIPAGATVSITSPNNVTVNSGALSLGDGASFTFGDAGAGPGVIASDAVTGFASDHPVTSNDSTVAGGQNITATSQLNIAGSDLDATGVTMDVSTAHVNITSGTLTTGAASIHVNPSTGTDINITFTEASVGMANASAVDPLLVAIGGDVTETRAELRLVGTDNGNLAQYTDPDTLSSGTYRVISTGTQLAILWNSDTDTVIDLGNGTHTYAGDTVIDRGALLLANPSGLSANSNLRLDADFDANNEVVASEAEFPAVLLTNGTFDRPIVAATGEVQFADFGGGFTAKGGTLDVNIGGGTALKWNMHLDYAAADDVVDFRNDVDLNGGTQAVLVVDNPNSANNRAVMSGLMTNGTLAKYGTGTLAITNVNNDVALRVVHGTLSVAWSDLTADFDAVPTPPRPKPAKTWADTKEILAVADKLSAEKEAELDRQLIVKYGITLEEIRTVHDRRVQPIVRADTGRTGNRYAKINENDFHAPGKAPLSTFSIDVDTASYAITRRALMESRRLPPPNAVRIEELVNYFHYDYEPPKGERPFAAHMEVAGCPWQPKHRLVRIALKGKEIHHQERPAANLVFLVDVSGSMGSADKLPLVQRGLQMLVESLSGRDRVGLVVYASRTGMVLPSTSIDQRELILSKIGELSSGGSTNGGDGIRLAYEQAQKNFIKGGTNRVILCTDGDFNVGTVNTEQLVDLVKEKAQGGVFITALGFGTGNHNDAMMEKISNSGNGNYFYVDSQAEARKVFVEELSGTLVTIAKDVKIQVEFNPEEVDAYRLIGYENRRLAAKDFNDDKKDAGEIGAGHTVTAIYEIVPTVAAASTPDGQPAVDRLKYQKVAKEAARPAKKTAKKNHGGEMLTLKIRYKQPDGHKSTKIEFVLKDDGTRFANASDEMQFASAVASFGMLLRGSKYCGDANFDSVLEIAGAALGEDKQGRRKEFLDIVRRAKGLR
jgi:Ca-activated chloride channel family protein